MPCLCLALACLFCFLTAADTAMAQKEPDILTVVNQSSRDLLNIRFQNKKEISFIRLDMSPGAQEDIENPGIATELRADTGLYLETFAKVPLNAVQRLIFCGEHSACLILEKSGHKPYHQQGQRLSLLPQDGDRPVCNLEQFSPGMSMRDVCALLSPDLPRDDNEALLTGLGFAGMTWAARLSPAHAETDSRQQPAPDGQSLLGHLELRRPLEVKDLQKLFLHLYSQGYTPWQAELPGLDMDFTEMADMNAARHKSLLAQALRHFMEVARGEATVMLAPATMLPALADADTPQADVQLFTVTLRQASRILIVDVAAYPGNPQP